MLVWMTGELDYAEILYPKSENIHLVKERDHKEEPHYVGYSQKSNDSLQFAGVYKLY